MAGYSPTDLNPETEHGKKWEMGSQTVFFDSVFACVYVVPYSVQVLVEVQTGLPISTYVFVVIAHTR